MKRFLTFLVLSATIFASKGQESEINKMIESQVDCWNNGDLECYMNGYLNSDDLVFVGSNGPKYGWQVTLNNYKKSYPTKESMGNLKLETIKLQPLAKKHYLVIGKWVLSRNQSTHRGYFSYVLEKIKGEWKIIADHSS
jgi:ketosteroid isomerase-like protein